VVRALGPIQPPVKWVRSLLPGGKAAGAWHDHQMLYSNEFKERVEQILYSPSGPSWPTQSCTLHA
jgi:hypothetical protein